MAIARARIDFILDQMKDAGNVRAKPMFGAAAFYCDDKVVALADEGELFIKPTATGKAFIGEVVEAAPYEGAKLFYRLSADQCADADWLARLTRITADALPAPKPKKRKA